MPEPHDSHSTASIGVTIVEDSISPLNRRLTTMLMTYPRFIHSELMTHRAFSRNAASSRAIPVRRMLEQVEYAPVYPREWYRETRGMTSHDPLGAVVQENAEEVWKVGCGYAITTAKQLLGLGVHKSITNRVLEPFSWMTVLVTATEWENFFALRASHLAQPEFRLLAEDALEAYNNSWPKPVEFNMWHLPFVDDDEVDKLTFQEQVKLSVARCARLSYLNFEGRRDYRLDIQLHDKLKEDGHWSPFEHQARPLREDVACGNLQGWRQYRKFFPGEVLSDSRVIRKTFKEALARQKKEEHA